MYNSESSTKKPDILISDVEELKFLSFFHQFYPSLPFTQYSQIEYSGNPLEISHEPRHSTLIPALQHAETPQLASSKAATHDSFGTLTLYNSHQANNNWLNNFQFQGTASAL